MSFNRQSFVGNFAGGGVCLVWGLGFRAKGLGFRARVLWFRARFWVRLDIQGSPGAAEDLLGFGGLRVQDFLCASN